MNPSLAKTIIWGVYKNKSTVRTLMNYELSQVPSLRGDILDLGSTNSRPSYFKFLRLDDAASIVSCDLSSDSDVRADFEKGLPFSDERFDYILCLNLLEHIFNFNNLSYEMHRVLKRGGTLIGFVPFLIRIHNDPNDYFRYSGQALEKVFREAGFLRVYIRPIGAGPMTASYAQMEPYIPRVIRLLFISIARSADLVLKKVKPSINESRHPLGYFFTCEKNSAA